MEILFKHEGRESLLKEKTDILNIKVYHKKHKAKSNVKKIAKCQTTVNMVFIGRASRNNYKINILKRKIVSVHKGTVCTSRK